MLYSQIISIHLTQQLLVFHNLKTQFPAMILLLRETLTLLLFCLSVCLYVFPTPSCFIFSLSNWPSPCFSLIHSHFSKIQIVCLFPFFQVNLSLFSCFSVFNMFYILFCSLSLSLSHSHSLILLIENININVLRTVKGNNTRMCLRVEDVNWKLVDCRQNGVLVRWIVC